MKGIGSANSFYSIKNKSAGIRILLFGLILLTCGAFYQFWVQGQGSGQTFGRFSGLFLGIFAALALILTVEIVLAVLVGRPGGGWLLAGWDRLESALRPLGRVNWVLFLGIGFFYAWFPLGKYSDNLKDLLPRAWIFTYFVLAGTLLLQALDREHGFSFHLLASALTYGAIYQAMSFLPDVSTSAISLTWSEGSRYFNASMFFAQSLYGQKLPLPVLHPSRYLMQSIPFLLPFLPLWFHRLWQVLLWIVFTWLGAYAAARRLKLQQSTQILLLAAWGFLFLFCGPVYYHLIACALPVLLWFDRGKFWRSMSIVLISSMWAGLSRINWFPVPGALAVLLYILETPVSGEIFYTYLKRPALWFAGGLAASFATQLLYIRISGNPPYYFGSSFTSGLIWQRLFPNATLGPGILLASGLFFLPYLAGMIWFGRGIGWHPLRKAVVIITLTVFYLGGVVVSIKVGGGSNLHNMDAFLLLILVVGEYLLFRRYAPDAGKNAETIPFTPPWWAVTVMVAIPLANALAAGAPYGVTNDSQVKLDLAKLNALVEPVIQQGGDVLFITQTQLLPFHYVDVKRIYPQYDKVFLMEMAMADNQRFLDDFYTDLREHRFELILSEPLRPFTKGDEQAFAVENNLWVQRVTDPLLQYYRVKMNLENINVQVLVPRTP